MKHNYLKKSFDFAAAIRFINTCTYAVAVTFLVVLVAGCLACLGAWVFGVL